MVTARALDSKIKSPILVTGAADRVGAVGRTVVELLRQRGLPVRASVHREDERAGQGVQPRTTSMHPPILLCSAQSRCRDYPSSAVLKVE
jgi:nucleoside-diphosphate-sugar epimerase